MAERTTTARPYAKAIFALARKGNSLAATSASLIRAAEVVADPRVHLVGYGPSASTIGANRAGQAAARELRRLLRPDNDLPRSA